MRKRWVKRPWLPMGGLLVLLWGAAILLQGCEADRGRGPQLQVIPDSYNFGTVGRFNGTVQATFVLRNRGDAPLPIRQIKTS